MADFLLELFSEEIPARMQRRAAEDLRQGFAEALGAAGLAAERIDAFVTPRRLALLAHGLPDATAAVSEERRGPRADAPAQAVEGFLKSTGLTRDQLEERDDAKGRFLYAVIDKPGRPTAEMLGAIVPALVAGFAWPKSMRWGASSADEGAFRWVRPLQSIVALLGDAVVPLEIAGVRSGRVTQGHRFLHDGPVEIPAPAAYAATLRAAHVIVDPLERQAIIADHAARLAREAGLELIEDEGLLVENAGLTEWPVPLLGSFDPAFLDVPPEVIQLTARVNQKYFVLRDAVGKLAPNFICVANIEASDGGAAIVAGNRKVLAARLSDAKFFWDQDRSQPLEAYLPKLRNIVFHEKLGTVASKSARIEILARWVATFVPNADAALAARAAQLSKADLVTGMVGEFPELQGIMGGYYAITPDLPRQISDAIRDHYRPVGQGDDLPHTPVGIALSLADKLDTLFAFFAVGDAPTGSRDPYALRRAAIGVVRLLIQHDIRLGLKAIEKAVFVNLTRDIAQQWPDTDGQVQPLVRQWYEAQQTDRPVSLTEDGTPYRLQENGENRTWYSDELARVMTALVALHSQLAESSGAIFAFLADRLKVQQREAGVRHDFIDAVFALGGEDDLVRLLARVKALQAFVGTEDGSNLLAGYKRAANILRIEEKKDGRSYDAPVDPVLLTIPQEVELAREVEGVRAEAGLAVENEDFAGAMAALSRLRPAVDAFFNHVTVNDNDAEVRVNRLNLLARIREAVHAVADFSKIEG